MPHAAVPPEISGESDSRETNARLRERDVFMTEQEYLSAVREARAHIDRGGEEELRKGERGLAALRKIYPKRLPYIAAEAALMLARGADVESCRAVIDFTIQEFHPQEGLSDLFELKSRTYEENAPERRQLRFISEFYRTGALPQEPRLVFAEMRRAFLAGEMDADALHTFAIACYAARNTLLSAVLMLAWCRQTDCIESYGDHVLLDAGQPYAHPAYSGNFSYLARMLTDGKAYTFLLLDDLAGDPADIDVLAAALHLLGQNTILLRECDAVSTVQDERAYALQCIQEAESVRNDIVITVGRCRDASGAIIDAVPAVIRLLTQSISQEAPLIVFARDGRMGELHRRTALAGEIQRLSHCLPPSFSYGFSFAWVGDYLKYISYLYGESVENLLAAPPSCDFSIVIPVRNSAKTLRSTLATCLAMDYTGSYEIVISDNSDADCTAIYDLCMELDDPHIRYYRTPVPLALDKSFEYAYLHARGDFIFSIGADDGVYPWTLRYLQKALADHPNEYLFGWRRALFLWPGLLEHERSYLRVFLYEEGVSKPYTLFGLSAQLDDTIERIDDGFYELPLFYINSGFRRSYLQVLLNRTGRILDGVSQDSYMGTVNLLVNKHFIRINAPLTLAGMSGSSIGAGSLHFKTDVAAASASVMRKKGAQEQHSEYVLRDMELSVPYIDTADKVGFYISLARLQEMGVTDLRLPEEAYFSYFVRNMYVSDLQFERFFGMMFYGASLCSTVNPYQCEAFYKNICANPKQVEDPEPELFSAYETGYSAENEQLTLDARDFDCRNIADAVALTARILHL